MTHAQVKDACEALGLVVRQEPDTGARSWSATYTVPGVRVYWRSSYEGGLLGLPRVRSAARDTHARSLREIKYLTQVAKDETENIQRQTH